MKKLLIISMVSAVFLLPMGAFALSQTRDVAKFSCDTEGYAQGCLKVQQFTDNGNSCYVVFDEKSVNGTNRNSSISCVKQ